MHPFFRTAFWLANVKRRYGVTVCWHCQAVLCEVKPTFVSLAPFLGIGVVLLWH